MKHVKKKLIAMMLMGILVFAGCANEDIGIVIHSDGSGSVTGTVRIEKEAYMNYIKRQSEEWQLSVAEMTEFVDKEMKKEGFQPVNIGGKEYYQMEETEKIRKGKLQKYFGGEDASYVTTDTVYLVLSKGYGDDEMYSSMINSGISEGSVSLTVTVQLPAPIVNTNGKVDASNPNKAEFSVPWNKNATIFATTQKQVTISSIKSKIKKLNAVKATKITKLKQDKGKKKAKKAVVLLKFKKVKGALKYEIQYSEKKNFKKAKSIIVKKNSNTIKKLKKGKKYYVRVRALKKNYAGVIVYSSWAKAKIKTKKE